MSDLETDIVSVDFQPRGKKRKVKREDAPKEEKKDKPKKVQLSHLKKPLVPSGQDVKARMHASW